MSRLPSLLVTSISAIAFLTACSSDATSDRKGSDNTARSEQERNEMLLADNMKKQGNLLGAGQLYAQVASKSTTSVDALLELVAIDRKLGRTEEAIEIAKEAQKRQPENPAVLSQLGYALIDAGKPQEAVDIFDMLIAVKPDYALAHNGKGVAFDKAGNHLAAQELYTRALILAPDSLSVQNNMAMSLILNKQYDGAILILEKLRLQYSENKTVRQNLALAYGLKGDAPRALALNLKDLSPEQAEENQRFYEHYSQKSKALKVSDVPAQMQIGFTETPAEQKDKVAPAAGKAIPKIETPTPSIAAEMPPAAPSDEPKKLKVIKLEPAPETPPVAVTPAPEIVADQVIKGTESPVLEGSDKGGTQLPTRSETSSEYPSTRR